PAEARAENSSRDTAKATHTGAEKGAEQQSIVEDRRFVAVKSLGLREGNDDTAGVSEAPRGQQRYHHLAPLLVEAVVLARFDHHGEGHGRQPPVYQVELIPPQRPQLGAGPIPHVLVQHEIVGLGDTGLNLDELVDVSSRRRGQRSLGNVGAVIDAVPPIALVAGSRRRGQHPAGTQQAADYQSPFQRHWVVSYWVSRQSAPGSDLRSVLDCRLPAAHYLLFIGHRSGRAGQRSTGVRSAGRRTCDGCRS